MTPEDSDFVCNCGSIELPETEEEKEKFVQDYKKEVKKELIVPAIITVVLLHELHFLVHHHHHREIKKDTSCSVSGLA